MSTGSVSCKEVMSHICESLGEELQSPRCVAIKAHLEQCDCCQQYFHQVEQVISFYREYDPELPPDMHQRLFEKLHLTGF